jgi:threonine dehydratase
MVLSRRVGAEVVAKWENRQATGSFKARGALALLTTLPPAVLARGVVAASSGNHGAAVAYGAERLGAPALVFVPEGASPVKLAKIRALGAEVHLHGTDSLDAEIFARSHAEAHGMTYLSPYNDPEVIAGQGTVGVELLRQLDRADVLVVAVGGGGLIAGIAGVLKAAWPHLHVIGAQPAASAVMAESVRAGRILDIPSLPTLSDGTAGGIEPGAITFPLCQTLVDEYILIDEAAIAAAMQLIHDEENEQIEGAAGVAVAACLAADERVRGGRVVVVMCGGNR